MKYLEVEPPHGFLIWRGKQASIANDEILPGDEFLLVCNNETYGKITLAQPAAVSLSEFERLEDEHCIRPEERKMLWPDLDAFFVHKIKAFESFPESLPVRMTDGDAEIITQEELTVDETELVKQAERLPKTIVVDDNAVVLDGDVIQMTSKIDYLKMLQAYEAAIGQKGIQGRLPLYKLALIRHPHLMIEKTKQEGDIMPYEIMEGHEECTEPYAVIKSGTGELVGCHATEEEAAAQITALNIAEAIPMEEEMDSAEAKQFDDAEWDGAASNWDTADAYCRDSLIDVNPAGEDKIKDLCFLPFRRPGAQNPNINSLRTMPTGRGIVALERPDGVPAERWDAQVQAAANKLIGWWPEAFDKPAPPSIFRLAGKEPPAGESQASEPAAEEKEGRRLKKTWRQKLQEAYETIKEMLAWSDYEGEDKQLVIGTTGFRIKQINGEPWFLAWSTNAFKDREGEIFSTKALEKYVSEAEKNEDRGYFNLWHIPGTDFAKKEWQGVVGRILVEAGPFLKDAKGQAALKFFKQHPANHPGLAPEGWGMSPEYRFLPEDRDDKVYDWVWITRTSVLAKAAAANVYTKGGLQMALSEDQVKAAQEIFGEALAGQIIKEAETESKELEQAGVAHKGKDEPAPTAEEIANELLKHFNLTEALTELNEKIAAVEAKVEAKLAEMEQTAATKAANDITKAMFRATRASQAPETEVEDGDKLKTQKPKETQYDKSLAGTFFQSPK